MAERHMAERQLAIIDVAAGAVMESQSGLQANRPRIYGAYEEPGGRARVAAIVMHPTSNFMGHYLISPLARRGICCMGLNSRYAGNDSVLIMERVIQDLGAGIKFLRARGYDRIILLGNSGGGAMAAFYQAQAEALTAHHTPAGDPTGLVAEDLPPVDGIALNAAHAGRSRLLAEWLDPSVIAEWDNRSADPALDMYDPANGPSYSADFLSRFRDAQRRRKARLDHWVESRLRLLRANPDGPQDEAFVIHRTYADPRFLDLGIDPNDRAPGGIWANGDARAVNYAANALGRYTTLTAYMSQWSARSQADGPSNLARTSAPVLFLEHTADGSSFPSTTALWLEAAGKRASVDRVVGGNHYLHGQPELVEFVADRIAEWAQGL